MSNSKRRNHFLKVYPKLIRILSDTRKVYRWNTKKKFAIPREWGMREMKRLYTALSTLEREHAWITTLRIYHKIDEAMDKSYMVITVTEARQFNK